MPKVQVARGDMSTQKTFLDTNVYEEAKNRIRHALNLYDSIVVAFSGGKDSLAVLHLVKEVYEELGIKSPVNAIFRDEEVIPDCVIDFVDEYRKQSWLNLKWFCVPLKSSKFILGKTHDYVQWDPARAGNWVREKPSWGITHSDPNTVFDQYTMDSHVGSFYRGKVCVLTGVRAQESLMRLRAILSKINDTTFASTKDNRVSLGRVVYDWSEDDIFKYFYDRKIRYCPIYNHQAVNGEQYRVSTPLHAESAKRMSVLRTRDPLFYERIVKVFPEVVVQEKYYSALNLEAAWQDYPQTHAGVLKFIKDTITDTRQRALALDRYENVMSMVRSGNKRYPPDYLFRVFATGAFKRQILPK